ncbi:MAG: Hsp20/alpha crystallin family protein [Anaerolineae bacterium]
MADNNEEVKQMEQVEKEEIAESEAERTRARPAFVPRADIRETEDAIELVLDVPGVDADSVDITLEGDTLSIEGYTDPSVPEGYQLAYAEYRVGDYRRRFAIGSEIDQDGIEAKVKDGVLRLRLPKVEEAKTKRVTVKAA